MAIKMKKNLRRMTALLLSAVMTIGFSLTTYANEPDMAQTSEADAAENDDRVQAVLPTDAVGIFDFILDPQELIYKTNASAYDGQTFEEGATLFFKRSDGEVLENYSSTSDAVTITNTGSTPIDVAITAGITVQAKEEFAMTDDREFTEDTRPSLYLALTDGETEIPIMGDGEEAAIVNITVPPVSKEEPEDNVYSFRLTGAANKEGDWSRLKNISFEVSVTWVVAAQEEETDSEEAPLENEESDLSGVQEKDTEPVKDPGEEIIRKKVPVVSDSNVIPEDVKSEILPTDKMQEEGDDPESNPEEESTVSGEKMAEPEIVESEETTRVKNVTEDEKTVP